MRRVQAIAVVAMAPFLSPLWPDGWGQQMSLGPAFAYAAPFDADLVYAEASGQGAALSPDHYSARWFILQMRDLSLRHQPKQAMQLAYLGLQTHPQSPVLQLALANLGYATGRCDWVRAHLLEIRGMPLRPNFASLVETLFIVVLAGGSTASVWAALAENITPMEGAVT